MSKPGRGRAARQPSDARFKVGSTPAGPIDSSVEQSGVLAALTSRRSLVQIQPGLLNDYLPLPLFATSHVNLS